MSKSAPALTAKKRRQSKRQRLRIKSPECWVPYVPSYEQYVDHLSGLKPVSHTRYKDTMRSLKFLLSRDFGFEFETVIPVHPSLKYGGHWVTELNNGECWGKWGRNFFVELNKSYPYLDQSVLSSLDSLCFYEFHPECNLQSDPI